MQEGELATHKMWWSVFRCIQILKYVDDIQNCNKLRKLLNRILSTMIMISLLRVWYSVGETGFYLV